MGESEFCLQVGGVNRISIDQFTEDLILSISDHKLNYKSNDQKIKKKSCYRWDYHWESLGFLLGTDGDVLQQQGFDLLRANVFLDVACGGGELDERWFRVNEDVDLAVLVLPTHIPRIDLVEGSLAVVQLNLSLTLHEILSFLILSNPSPSGLAGSHTDVDQIRCVTKTLQFMTSLS